MQAGQCISILKSAAPRHRRAIKTFTSQLYFDEAVTDQIFKQAPYNGKDGRRTMNNGDSIFRRDGKELLLVPAKTSQGYSATFDIGLQLELSVIFETKPAENLFSHRASVEWRICCSFEKLRLAQFFRSFLLARDAARSSSLAFLNAC